MNGISVIVPVYNSEKYLKICFTSLLSQTIKDIEIIVINDGSQDNSDSIIRKYVKKYPSLFKYINNKENKGLGYVRNLGIEKSSKKYIAFVDSDDYIEPNMFEKMVEECEKKDADVCECNFVWEWPNKQKFDIKENYNLDKSVLTHIRVLAPNKIYKRELLIKNNIRFAEEKLRYEDILFTFSLFPFIKKMCFIDDIFYHYIQRGTSIINNQNKKVSDIYKVLEKVEDFYKENNLYKEYFEELEYNYARFILLSSLKRASHIKNKKDRKEVLKEGYNLLNNKYPNFKKNKYLKGKGLKKIYMRTINKCTYNLVAFLMRFVK